MEINTVKHRINIQPQPIFVGSTAESWPKIVTRFNDLKSHYGLLRRFVHNFLFYLDQVAFLLT